MGLRDLQFRSAHRRGRRRRTDSGIRRGWRLRSGAGIRRAGRDFAGIERGCHSVGCGGKNVDRSLRQRDFHLIRGAAKLLGPVKARPEPGWPLRATAAAATAKPELLRSGCSGASDGVTFPRPVRCQRSYWPRGSQRQASGTSARNVLSSAVFLSGRPAVGAGLQVARKGPSKSGANSPSILALRYSRAAGQSTVRLRLFLVICRLSVSRAFARRLLTVLRETSSHSAMAS